MTLINARRKELENASEMVYYKCFVCFFTHENLFNIILFIQSSKEEKQRDKAEFEEKLSNFTAACKELRCDFDVEDMILENGNLNVSELSLYNLQTDSMAATRVLKGHINNFAKEVKQARHNVQSRIRTKCSRIAYLYTFRRVNEILHQLFM